MKRIRVAIACAAACAGMAGLAVAQALIANAHPSSHSSNSSRARVTASATSSRQASVGDPDEETIPPKAEVVAVGAASFGAKMMNGDGKTVYVFSNDRAGHSSCRGACANTWLPVRSLGGKPRAGKGVAQADLGTIQRPDGSTQVTFRGLPLYYYADDSRASDAKGQRRTAFGGTWSAQPPSGKHATNSRGPVR